MIDRIEELLGRMAAEEEADSREDALTLPGERAARPAPPGKAGEETAGEAPAGSGPKASEDASAGPDVPEAPEDGADLSGLEELYREAARETLPSAGPAVPQGGRGEFAARAEEPGSAASLAVEELDRAVRRDSRRYDGEMSIY